MTIVYGSQHYDDFKDKDKKVRNLKKELKGNSVRFWFEDNFILYRYKEVRM